MPPADRLTPDRRKSLLRWLRGGLPIATAARMAGISEQTVEEWMAKSRNRVPGYIKLNEEIEHAMAEGETVHLARISEAGKESWRASAWLLERMYPDRWGPPLPVDIPDAPPQASPSDDLAGL